MSRHVTRATIVCLAAAACAGRAECGEVIFSDDFDGGLPKWSLVDNSSGHAWGPGIFETSQGEFHMETTGEFPGGGEWFDTSLFGVIVASRQDNRFADGVLKTNIRVGEDQHYVTIGLRWPGSLNNYSFTAFTDTGTFEILRGDTLPIPAIARSEEGLFDPGDTWIVEAGAIDDRLTMRFWPSDGPRPEVPQLAIIDPEPFGSSGIYIGGGFDGGGQGKTNVTMDEVEFISFPSWVDGDFSVSGHLDAADIDALSKKVQMGDDDRFYDLTGDDIVDHDDRRFWIKNLKQTYLGDSNLDGEFSSQDFVTVFEVGRFETGDSSGWAEGDWNGDGFFTTGDFVRAFQEGGYEQGARVAVNAVPEPASFVLLMTGLLGIAKHGRRKRH